MRGSLMRLCTEAQHKGVLARQPDNKEAAKEYSIVMKKPVSPQNVAYWRKVFATSQVKADREYYGQRRLRVPSPDDDIGSRLPDLRRVYRSVLVIPDQHEPYGHPDSLAFLSAVQVAFCPDLVVNLGDEGDYHGLSFHDSDPNLDSAGVELTKLQERIGKQYKLFPIELVCNSNHGSMVYRKAKHHGIPVQALKSYREILFPEHKAPGWSWADQWIVKTPLGEVMFKHQSSNVLADAAHERCNLIVGHNHSKFEVAYAAGSDYLYWGATSGCLVDNRSMAFAYGKNFTKKPIIGCTVILEGRPVLVPMVLNNEGRWIGRL